MIKLIASDLDGTLLQNGAQNLNDNTCDLIQELQQAGILFCPASGRTYSNLRRLFAPVVDDVVFMCENGALVVYQDRVIAKSVFPHQLAMDLIHEVINLQGCEVLVSGERTAYIKPKQEAYQNLLTDIIGVDVTIVEDFENLPEQIIKISLYQEGGVDHVHAVYFQDKFPEITPTVSGLPWLDFIREDSNKGTGMREIQKYFGYTREECAAFGDNYNDLEMVQEVTHSFAMENGIQELKDSCRYCSRQVEESLQQILAEEAPVSIQE